MSKNLKYHVALTVKDQATSGIKKAMAEMERGETKRAQSYKRFSDARRNLSIRAESDIQREIKRTEASYNRLARAGLTCPPKTSPFFKLVVEWTWEDGKWLRKHLPRNRLSLSFGK